MKKLRIGFLSTAGIGKKTGRRSSNSGNCVVSAVASRDVGKSHKFIDECQREFKFENTLLAFGSYEELLASKNVDAIYIPLPTALRKEFVIHAAQNGKHVLCEKPCANNSAELEAVISACKKNRVQFMDGVMFMHSPRSVEKVREVLTLDDAKSVGEIRRISSAFSFYVGEDFFRNNIRVDGKLEPAGCLGVTGWYCIRFALWTMNWQLPREVTGKILSQSENLPDRPSAPTEFSAELVFAGATSLRRIFYCSFLAAFQQWISVSGQKKAGCGCRISSIPPELEAVTNPLLRSIAMKSAPPPAQNVRRALTRCHKATRQRRTRKCSAILRTRVIFSGKLNEDWPMWALKTQQVLDACHEAALRGTVVKL